MVITAVGEPLDESDELTRQRTTVGKKRKSPKTSILDIVRETDQQFDQDVKGLLGEGYYAKRKRTSSKKSSSKKSKKPMTLFGKLFGARENEYHKQAVKKLTRGAIRRKPKKKSTQKKKPKKKPTQKKKRSTQGKKKRGSKRTLRRR